MNQEDWSDHHGNALPSTQEQRKTPSFIRFPRTHENKEWPQAAQQASPHRPQDPNHLSYPTDCFCKEAFNTTNTNARAQAQAFFFISPSGCPVGAAPAPSGEQPIPSIPKEPKTAPTGHPALFDLPHACGRGAQRSEAEGVFLYSRLTNPCPLAALGLAGLLCNQRR